MLENLEALKDNDIRKVSGGAYSGPCFVYTIQRLPLRSLPDQQYQKPEPDLRIQQAPHSLQGTSGEEAIQKATEPLE